MLGLGGKIYVPLDKYSLVISFCVVPESFFLSPCFHSGYIQCRSQAAGALMVIDVFIFL